MDNSALPSSARVLVSKAAGWWTVAYEVDATWRKVEGKTNVVVQGWRGRRQFLAVWADGKADCAYWWTTEHEAWADLPRELVRWTTPAPAPVKVSFAELKRLLKLNGEMG